MIETRRAPLKARSWPAASREPDNGRPTRPLSVSAIRVLGSGGMFSGKFVTSSCNAPASRSN